MPILNGNLCWQRGCLILIYSYEIWAITRVTRAIKSNIQSSLCHEEISYVYLLYICVKMSDLRLFDGRNFLSSATDRPKITSNLTNIQSSINEAESIGQEAVAYKKPIEQQKEDEEEKAKDRERSKRMMNYGFAAFGVFMGIGFTYLVYELGRPNYDEHGNVIEDEFSNLPFFEQIYKRVRRELNYYTKVRCFYN